MTDQTRPRLLLSRCRQNLALWAVWFLPMIAFFSMTNLFHRYYLEMLAPAIAALVGAGVAAMWQDYRQNGLRGWLPPLALLASAAFEVLILAEFPDWSLWLTPIVLEWALIPVLHGNHAGLPYAGPDLLTEQKRNWNSQDSMGDDQLATYLQANQGDATYLAATMRATTASPLIPATGEPVMAMGSFSGGDQILTVNELQEMVANGEVCFFLLESQGNRQGNLTRWVTQHCRAVPQQEWGSAPSGNPGGPTQLFDCEVVAGG